MTTAQQQQRQRASARDRAEQHGSKMADYLKLPSKQKLWRPEAAGVVLIDILPYVVGQGNPYADAGQLFYERTFYIYTDLGPNRERCIAPSKTWKQRDPVAEYRQQLADSMGKDRTKAEKEQLSALWPKERQVFNCFINRDYRQFYVMEYSNFGFGELLDERVKQKEQYSDFWYGNGGHTLEVNFTEVPIGNGSFLKAKSIDFEKRQGWDEEQLLQHTACLDDCLVPIGYDELYKLFFQVDGNAGSNPDARPPGTQVAQQPAGRPEDAWGQSTSGPATQAAPPAAKPSDDGWGAPAPAAPAAPPTQAPPQAAPVQQPPANDGWGPTPPGPQAQPAAAQAAPWEAPVQYRDPAQAPPAAAPAVVQQAPPAAQDGWGPPPPTQAPPQAAPVQQPPAQAAPPAAQDGWGAPAQPAAAAPAGGSNWDDGWK